MQQEILLILMEAVEVELVQKTLVHYQVVQVLKVLLLLLNMFNLLIDR